MIKYLEKTRKKLKIFFQSFLITDYINMFLLFLVIGVVPLIVKFKGMIYTKEEFEAIRINKEYLDLFSYYKSQIIILCCVVIFLSYMLTVLSTGKGFDFKKLVKDKIVIATFVFLGFAILSSLFSKYKNVVYLGISQRYEGLFVLISYFIILFAVKQFVLKKNGAKAIIYFIMFSAFFIGVIGLFQFLKKDLLITDFFVKLILGKSYTEGQKLTQTFTNVYATLFNPNCVGLYASMMFPFSFILGICYNRKSIFKYVLLVISILMFIILRGSGSEAAIIALAFQILLIIFIATVLLLNRKFNINIKYIFATILVLIVLFFPMYIFVKPVNNNINALLTKAINMTTPPSSAFFKDMEVKLNTITFDSEQGKITLEYNKDTKICTVYDKDNNIVIGEKQDQKSGDITKYEAGSFGVFYIQYLADKFAFAHSNGINMIMKTDENNNIIVLDLKERLIDLNVKVPSTGFYGHETFASSRGYIWSRTLPLLKDKMFLGSGPDTFILDFPQQDVVGKIRNFGNPYIIVDKAHNIYLQTALNTSILSLVALLFIFGSYIISTLRILFCEKIQDRFLFSLALAILVGIFGYLITAMSTDSVVSVAPVFWTMLGLGFATNNLCTMKKD